MSTLQRLELLMQRLRDPDSGCPWDRQQTMQSLLPHTLEEVYELADAIERKDLDHLKEELGDYLFQAAFYAQIAVEQGRFTLSEVIDALVDKLVSRHPHVFPDGLLDGNRVPADKMDEAGIKKTWERLKVESRHSRQQTAVLDDVPRALPALQRAQKLQKRAALHGFDWPDADGPRAKLNEEIAEFDAVTDKQDTAGIEAEIGDLMFTCVNLARHHRVDAEQALARANHRFEDRFAHIEARLEQRGEKLEDLSLDELEMLWQEAKR